MGGAWNDGTGVGNQEAGYVDMWGICFALLGCFHGGGMISEQCSARAQCGGCATRAAIVNVLCV